MHIHNHTSAYFKFIIDLIFRTSTNLPIAAYHVSGEYAMLKAAVQKVYVFFCIFINRMFNYNII